MSAGDFADATRCTGIFREFLAIVEDTDGRPLDHFTIRNGTRLGSQLRFWHRNFEGVEAWAYAGDVPVITVLFSYSPFSRLGVHGQRKMRVAKIWAMMTG